MKLYLIPLSLLALGALPMAQAEAGAQLTGAEILSEIVGTPLKSSRMGMTAKIMHSEDGSSSLNAPVRTAAGSWEVVGDELCVTWEGEEEVRCSSFYRHKKADRYKVEPMGITVRIDKKG